MAGGVKGAGPGSANGVRISLTNFGQREKCLHPQSSAHVDRHLFSVSYFDRDKNQHVTRHLDPGLHQLPGLSAKDGIITVGNYLMFPGNDEYVEVGPKLLIDLSKKTGSEKKGSDKTIFVERSMNWLQGEGTPKPSHKLIERESRNGKMLQQT